MDSNGYSGSSKQRRDLLKNETDILGRELPFDYGKVSQLRILKAACSYFKKNKFFSRLRNNQLESRSTILDRFIYNDETLRNEGLSGFIVCFTKTGELVYVSDTTYEHLGIRSSDLMFTYEKITDMVHEQDKPNFNELEDNFDAYKNGQQFSFYSLWFVSKIKRNDKTLTEYKLIRMTGHFDAKTDLYVATCAQILSVSNREVMTTLSAECFTSVHDTKLGFQEVSTSVECLLGYDPVWDDLKTMSLYQLVASESLQIIKERHLQILQEKNTKGYLDPIRLLHKNGSFVDCLVNIYCDPKDQIVCKFQILSRQSMEDYKEYVLNFKRNWDLYKFQENSTSSNLNIDSDVNHTSRQQQQEADYSNFIAIEAPMSASKRHCDAVECENSKRFKLDYEELSSDISGNNDLADFEGVDLNEILQISNIKENIEKELNLMSISSSFNAEIRKEKAVFFDGGFNINDSCQFYENFYNNDSGYEDEQLYQALIEDNDLFESLQQAY